MDSVRRTQLPEDQPLAGVDARRPQASEACLHDRFERQVELTPNAVAIGCDGQSLTYGQLNVRANRLAHHLRELGVTQDQLIGLHTERGIDIVVGIIGILKAGAAYLPLDPIYPRDRIAYMLEDSGARVVVTQTPLSGTFEGTGVTQVLLDEPLSGPEDNPVSVVDKDNLAYVIYTSGSTGKPKGALISHHNVTRLFETTEEWFGFGERDVWTLFHSYAFDFSVWEMWGALIYGGRLVVVPQEISRSPEEFRELLVRESVTVLNQTPSAFRQLIQAELARPEADLSLRYVIFGGEALELQSLRPWFERYGDQQPQLVNMYGITETTVHVTYRPICWDDLRSGQGSVIGVPIPDLQLYILDADCRPVPVGETGEMYVGGAGVARGYLNRPELTTQRFIDDPFATVDGSRLYRTGDLARRLENGDIEYLGRMDHQVKIRGFRIELGEIEASVATHGAVNDVAVVAREDKPGDKQLVAYFVTTDHRPELVGELRELLRSRLPEYMVPAHFVRLDTLPLTENGKLDRNSLPVPARVSPDATYVAPRTPTEETLAAIWASVLGFDRVGVNDNFFEMGGNSLLVINVIQKMREAGLHADVSTLFLAPTIAAVAATVGADNTEIEVPPNLIPPDCKAIEPEMLPLVQLSPGEIERVVAAVPGGAANVQDIYPLSPLQEVMLFHHRMASEGDPYLVTTVFAATSRDQLDRYLDALQVVIDRHDILRTAFFGEGLSQPVQVVCRRATLVIEELELDPAEGDLVEQMERRYDPQHYRLDVCQAPIIRIFIAHDATNARWVMLRVHHHLLEDHTTDELMSDEIYELLQGRGDMLPPPLPFRNFIAQVTLGSPVEKHETFFREMLSDVDEPTAPFGFSDVLGGGPRIDEARHLLDADFSSRLRDAARRNGVSEASLFHLAWAKVLSQCSGRDDVVFGTVLFGRMHAGQGAERVLGPFINTLPLRIQTGDVTVEDGVRQAHTRMAQLLGHEHASLALAQSCSGVASSVPLFSALLNFRHLKIQGQIPESSNHAMAVAVSRLGLELLKFEERTNYPLELSVDDLGDGFMLEAQAQSPIDPNRICGYVRKALKQLVAALETSPTSTLANLDVIPGAERQQILEEWNDTARDYGDCFRLHRLIEEQVQQTPHAVALEFEGEQLAYAELNDRANQLARILRKKGIGPNVLVGVFAERSFEMVLAQLAVLKAGGAYVPLDPAYPAERLGHMLEDARTALVISQAHLLDRLPESSGEVLALDASWNSYSEESRDDLDDIGTPDDLAYVIFTSGSTGRPKGAMNAHRGICNRLHWMQEQYQLSPDDRVLQKTPFTFDVSVWEFYWPLMKGARLVIARPDGHRDNEYLAEIIRDTGITTLHFVPSMLRMFLEYESVEACTSLRRVICSGEALNYELQERFFARLPDVELHNLYGPTEAAVDVTFWQCLRGDARLTVPIGRPVANTQIYLLDERMAPVPVGVAGELYIGGVQVGRGYVGRDDLTEARFVRDPFASSEQARLYKTGDLARFLPDGAIEYLGRTDFQVKIRGQRVELGEIEATLDQHAGVAQSLVMLREDTPGDQRLVAYVVPRRTDVSGADMKEHLTQLLPVYMVPSAFSLLDELPLTSSGKVDRKQLPVPEYSDIASASYVAPQSPTEEIMSAIWAEVLKLERVGIHDNFFEIGGHSLLAVSVIERMRRADLHADIRELFVTPTIAELAAATGNSDDVVEVPPNLIPPECNSITPDMLTMVQLSAEEIDRVAAAVPGGAANIQDIYPLAPLQEGFLFHHLLTTEGDLYIMETQFAFDTRERLDNYIQALQGVVDRNDIMRSAFLWEGLQEPLQVVCREASLSVESVELDPADGDIAEQLAARFNLVNYRIDLSRPPMIRIFIARDEANDRWVFHQLTHHLMDDQATVNVQEEEIQAFMEGRGDSLPEPRRFRDYVAQTRLGVSPEEHEAFFRNMLGDVEEPTAPYEFSDVLGDGSRVDEARAILDGGLARRLFETGQRIGVSTASLFHLAWAQTLALLSGREDVVFGTCLLGRMHGGSGADRVLGPCINTLPMRIQVGDIGAQDSVRTTHKLLATLLRHEHALLGMAQRCSQVDANTPLFSSILNYRRPSQGVGRGGSSDGADGVLTENRDAADNLSVTEWFSEEIEGRTFIRFLERTNYPLTLSVDDFGDGFRLVAQVQAPSDPQRICDYMLAALEQLVDALATAPGTALRELRVLPQRERDQLLLEWNETKTEQAENALMHNSFEEHAKQEPERTALRVGTTVVSYTELDKRANRIALALRSRGIGRGQRVGLCVERDTEMLAAVLGVLKAGAAYVPLDPAFPRERLSFMAEDAELALLISTSALASLFELPRESQLLLDTDADELASMSGQRLGSDAELDARPEDPAYLIYTSGSTGLPKGVVVPHRAVVNFISSMAQEPGLTGDDVLVAVTTLSFDIAVLELQLPLARGGTVVIASRDESMDGHALKELLQVSGATVMQATPVTWRLLLEAGWAGKAPFKALVGGEALPKDLADDLLAHDVELWNMYGPTETTVWSTCARITGTSDGITIGKPIANTEVYVLDERGDPCPVGVPGELYIGGAGVTLGYWNRPELTAERFVPDSFSGQPNAKLYRTGDHARWRDDGTLEHLGRLDDQVKVRGFRVELGEIEAAIAGHPDMQQVAVRLWVVASDDVRIVACCVPMRNGALSPVALRRHLRTRLPDYMIPHYFLSVNEIPLTPNGKIDRGRLPTPVETESSIGRHEAPVDSVEATIAEIWTSLIQPVRPIGRHDRFFEMGGHSLLAMRALQQIASRLGVTLEFRILLEESVAEIASRCQVAGQQPEPGCGCPPTACTCPPDASTSYA
jgi:amino acid adenylation domain-containing protein